MIESGDMFNDFSEWRLLKKRPIGFGVDGKNGAFRNADDTTNYCSRLHYSGQMPLKHVHKTAKRSGNANASLGTSFSFLSV